MLRPEAVRTTALLYGKTLASAGRALRSWMLMGAVPGMGSVWNEGCARLDRTIQAFSSAQQRLLG